MAASTPTQNKPSAEINANDLQSELLGLLERAGSSAPPKPAAPPPPPVQAAAASVAKAAVVKSAPKPVAEPVDPDVTCIKCGNKDSWGTASWCPKCGYYPGLGHEGEIPQEESDGIEDLTFFDICPPWALQLVGGLIFIVVGTLVMERYLDGNVGWLSLTSMVQLGFGVILMLFAHKQAIMMGLNDPGCPSVMALITYPPSVWMPVLQNLRQRAHLLVTMVWGLCACVMALSLYGPIHMSEVKKEISESKKSKKSFMGKILGTMAQVSTAVQGSGGGSQNLNFDPNNPESLEDAIGGFAGIATEQGGLGDVINGAQTGDVEAMMQQAASEASGGMIAIGPGGIELPSDGGGGGGDGSLDGAIGNLTDVAASHIDLNDPDKVAKLAVGGVTGGHNGAELVASKGGSRSVPVESNIPPSTDTIPVATVTPSTSSSSSNGLARSTFSSKSNHAATNGTAPRSTSGKSSGSSTTAADNEIASKQAVVFGYLLSAGGEIRTLLIATIGADGRPRFAGKLGSDAMQPQQWEQITSSLPKLRVARPLVACPNAGYWVAPKLLLDISSSRWTQTGPMDAQVLSVEER